MPAETVRGSTGRYLKLTPEELNSRTRPNAGSTTYRVSWSQPTMVGATPTIRTGWVSPASERKTDLASGLASANLPVSDIAIDEIGAEAFCTGDTNRSRHQLGADRDWYREHNWSSGDQQEQGPPCVGPDTSHGPDHWSVRPPSPTGHVYLPRHGISRERFDLQQVVFDPQKLLTTPHHALESHRKFEPHCQRSVQVILLPGRRILK